MTLPSSANQDTPRGPIAWMARNPVVSNLLLLAMAIGGGLAALTIKQEVFPDFQADSVEVRVQYPGASPTEIESGIIRFVEEAVRSVEQVTEVVSRAREGSGVVTAEYQKGTDRMEVYQNIQQAVDRIRNRLPDEAEEAEIGVFQRRRDVFEITLYGRTDRWSLRNIAEQVKDQLLQNPDITDVEVENARAFEIHIEPSREALRRHGLTLAQIARKVAETSVELPGGRVKTDTGELLVRFDERKDYADEFRRIPLLTTPEGAVVTVGDIAEVSEGFEDVNRLGSYNGQPAIGIEIFRVGDQRPTDVARAAREEIQRIVKSLPEGIDFAIQEDNSITFRDRLDLLLRNFGIGLLLVLCLLGIFLELRLALWVVVGIPVSFLGAFLILPFFGVSLNMISMFAFIVALGIVVDDAIVVGESVYSWRERGLPPQAAAIRGATRMATPVAFSILTNIVAFMPLLFIPGWMGKIWFSIPIVVSSVFIMSWLESVFVLPSHLAELKERPRLAFIRWIDARQQKVSDLLHRGIIRFYRPALAVCIRSRYLVMACGLALLAVVIAYAQSGRMGMTLFPDVEDDEAGAQAWLRIGSPVEDVITVRDHLETAAWEVINAHGGDQLATGIFSQIDENRVRTRVFLTDPDTRPLTTGQFTELWREATGIPPIVRGVRFESNRRGGPGSGPALTVELSHANMETLEKASSALADILRQYPTVSDIDDGYNLGKEQLTYKLTPAGRALNLEAREVARQVRASFYGAEAVRQMRGQHEVKVLVRLDPEQRSSEADIDGLMIRTPQGGDIPLRQVAEVERGRSLRSIERRNGRRTIEVTAQVTPPERANEVVNAVRAEVMPRLQADFPGLSYAFEGRQADTRKSLGALGTGYLFAMLGVYFLLAIPFRSYVQPLVVMFAIPFGIVGAVLGHVVMDFSLSVISVMGIIALSGVVINDSLVMVVYANERRREGHPPFEAMLEAGVRRFRPILLTTLTTFGGLAPMIFETSRQARFMIPMAISLGYGLLFATAITLIIVPSLYLIIHDLTNVLKRLFGAEAEPVGDPAS